MAEQNQIINFILITFCIVMFSDAHFYIITTFFPKKNILFYEKFFSKFKEQISLEKIKFNNDYFSYLEKKQKSMLWILIPIFITLICILFSTIIFCSIKMTQNNSFFQENWYLLLALSLLWTSKVFYIFLVFYKLIKFKKHVSFIKKRNNIKDDSLLIEEQQEQEDLKIFELFKKENKTKINFFVIGDFYKIIQILKSGKSFEDFSNELYIFVICNFDHIMYEDTKFELSNFVWLWNNRKTVYENYLKQVR